MRNLSGVLSVLLWASLPLAAIAQMPGGGQVQSGQVSIQQPNATTLNVNNNSARAIVNWNSFSLGSNNTVNFNQAATSAILNRVVGANASNIYGKINSPGSVFLVNPNGILFGSSAQINVGSLVASTLNINNQDFLNGLYKFTGNSQYQVQNAGVVKAANNVYFLSNYRASNSGSIYAPNVQLLAGSQATLTSNLSDATLQSPATYSSAAARNTGYIEANHAKLQASGYQSYAANWGTVAAYATQNASGQIELRAAGSGSQAYNNGSLNAAGNAGKVTMTADYVNNDYYGNVNAKQINLTGTSQAYNIGILRAHGGTVTLSGKYAVNDGYYDNYGNYYYGLIDVSNNNANAGNVNLIATSGGGGYVFNGGVIDARAFGSTGRGGNVALQGPQVYTNNNIFVTGPSGRGTRTRNGQPF